MTPNREKKNIARQTNPLWWVRTLLVAVLVFVVVVGLVAGLGLAQRFGWLAGSDPINRVTTNGAIYTCPMHPQIRQPSPGRCPICGMELVPATAAVEEDDPFSVFIPPAARRLANIQTVEVKRAELSRTIRTIGSLAFDESRLATISSYVDGRIERMFADYTGVKVAKGDHLTRLYSPELYSAQVAYVESQETLKQMARNGGQFVIDSQRRLVDNARHQLIEYGMTEEQIKKLEKTRIAESRLTIHAPIGGTVIEKKAAEGDYIKTGQPIYRIADLNTVWLILELFPEEAAAIRHAQTVQAQVQALPGEIFEGRVAFIDPVVDPKTRTVAVRVEMLNPKGKLKPGDYADAGIHIRIGAKGQIYDADLAGKWISPMHPQIIRDEAGECPICGMDLVPASEFGYSEKPLPPPMALVLPRDAVLHVGKHSVVYVETEPGRFEIRPVVLGPMLDDLVVILQGVEEGEQVARSGNFLIDSQMQLAGKPSLIDPTKIDPKAPLRLQRYEIEQYTGATGKNLEKLYHSYFDIRETLAKDKTVSGEQVKALLAPARELLKDAELPKELPPYLKTIQSDAEHLHHLGLEGARKHFGNVSEAVIKLSAHARGAEAKETFIHFHCPMVENTRGDWLQEEEPLANPYHGSRMPDCGDTIHHLPPKGRPHRVGAQKAKQPAEKKAPAAHQH